MTTHPSISRTTLGTCLAAVLGLAVAFSNRCSAQESDVEAAPSVDTQAAPHLSPATEWQAFIADFEQSDFNGAWPHLERFVEACAAAPFGCPDSYGTSLLKSAELLANQGYRGLARTLTDSALKVSPRSPRVLLEALPLVIRTGARPILEYLGGTLSALVSNPFTLAEVVEVSLRPTLWALTLAFYFAALLVFCAEANEMMGRLARTVPTPLRGIGAPLLLAALVFSPVAFGPLWSVALYTLYIRLFLSHHRRFVLCGAAVVILWGACLPIGTNLAAWLHDPRGAALLRVAAGNFQEGDASLVQDLAARLPKEGVVLILAAQTFRHEGRLAEAKTLLERGEELLGSNGWISAEAAALAYQRKDLDEAERHFMAAQKQGYVTASLLFNYSKVKWDRFDLEGSDRLVKEAQHEDKRTVELLREREQRLGNRNPHSLGTVEPPLTLVLPLMTRPFPAQQPLNDGLARLLMRGATPPQMVLLGFALFLSGLAVSRRGVRPQAGLFAPFELPAAVRVLARFVPGGGHCAHGSPLVGFLMTAGFFALVLPLIGGPSQITAFPEFFRFVAPFYAALVVVALLALWYFDAEFMEGRECE